MHALTELFVSTTRHPPAFGSATVFFEPPASHLTTPGVPAAIDMAGADQSSELAALVVSRLNGCGGATVAILDSPLAPGFAGTPQ